MKTQARRWPVESKARLRLLIDRVEDHALPRIVNGELDERRAANVADGYGVVEEDRPRILRTGVESLHAGLRHDEHLRLDRHVQRLQHGSQVARALVERDPHGPFVDPAIQLDDRIGRGSRGVLDGGMRQRFGERPLGELSQRCRAERHGDRNRGRDEATFHARMVSQRWNNLR